MTLYQTICKQGNGFHCSISIRLIYLIFCPTGILQPRAGIWPFCVAILPRIDFAYRIITLLPNSNYLKEVHSLDCKDSLHFDVLYFASFPFGKFRDELFVVSLCVNLTQNLSLISFFCNCLRKVDFLFYIPLAFFIFFLFSFLLALFFSLLFIPMCKIAIVQMLLI